MGVLGLMTDFSGWTSAHGIPQIGASRNWVVRIIWTIIFAGAFGMFVYQMYKIIMSYLAFGVFVSTTLEFEARPFPSVTLCNRNAYKRSEAEKDPLLKQMMIDFEEAITDGKVTSSNDQFGFNNQSDNLEVISHAYVTMVYLTNKWTNDEVTARGYSLDDILIECKFNEMPCDLEKDFSIIRDPYYGNCFQFNNVDPPKYVIARPGPSFGLSLLLRNEQEEFMPMTEAAAFRITVHNQLQEPFPDAFGYVAAAGYVNSFSMKSSRTIRLPSPFPSKCTADNNVPTFYYGESAYTMEACFRSCYQKYVQEQCSCSDPRFAKLDENKFCELSDLSCVEELRNIQATDDSTKSFDVINDCECPKACNDTTYSVVATQAYWPSLVYKFDYCHNESLWMPWFNETSDDGSWDIVQKDNTLDCIKTFHDQTSIIKVYYERLTYQLYEENPSYGMTDVVFNFGGQIGLWMGFSVITMVEWIGLSILIALYCCAKAKGPQVIMPEGKHEQDLDEIDEILQGASSGDDDSDDDSDVDPYEGMSQVGDGLPPNLA